VDCDKAIDAIRARLDAPYESAKQVLTLEAECVGALSELDAECSEALMRVGYSLLERAGVSDSDEYAFGVILQAIANRHQPGALDLTAAALMGDKTGSKEDYVGLLDSYHDARAIPALVYAVQHNPPLDEEGGWVRARAIDALRSLGAREAAGVVIPCVQDIAYRVRRAAIGFLTRLNVTAAADTFVARVRDEDDPDVLEALVDGLVLWERADSLPDLRDLSTSDWVTQDKSLRSALDVAIVALERDNRQPAVVAR